MGGVRPEGRGRGFTLIELVVILLVISIIAAVAVPKLTTFGIQQSNRFAASRFLAETRYARAEAVAEGRTHRLVFDAQRADFRLQADNGVGTFEDVKSDLGGRVGLGDGVSVETELPKHEEAGTYIEFKASGLTEAGRVTFRNKLGGTVVVACETETEQYRMLKEGER